MTKHTILFLAANPLGTDRLALEQEAPAIQQEPERSVHGCTFELVTRWAARPLDLLRALRNLKPTVVHFGGFSGERGEVRLDVGARQELVEEAGSVDGNHLHGLTFPGSDPLRLVPLQSSNKRSAQPGPRCRLVILNACYPDMQAEALLAHVNRLHISTNAGCIVSQPDECDLTNDEGGQKLFKLLLEGANLSSEHIGRDATEVMEELEHRYDELSGHDKNEEAVAVAQKLVWISMQLLPVNPRSVAGLVAHNLDRLSDALSRVGRREKAVLVRHQAICGFRAQVERYAKPAFLPRLVLALIAQSQDLLLTEQPKWALSALQEAQQYNRILVRHDEDASARFEGLRLARLTHTLLEMRDSAAALEVGKATAEHYRRLVASGKAGFRVELAGHLVNLSGAFRSVGSFAEGRATAQEAVDRFRELAAEDRDSYQLHVAHSLYSLGCAWLRTPPHLGGEGSMFFHIANPLTEQERAEMCRAFRECGAILLRCGHGADPYQWVMLARGTAIRLDTANDLRDWHLPLILQLAEYRELAVEPRHADLFLELQALVAQCAWSILHGLPRSEHALRDHGVAVIVSAFHSPDLTRWRARVDGEGRSMAKMAHLTRIDLEHVLKKQVMQPVRSHGGMVVARRKATSATRTRKSNDAVDETEHKLRMTSKQMREDRAGARVETPGRSDVLDILALRKLAGFEQAGALLCLLELSFFSHPYLVGALVHADGRPTQLLDFAELHDLLVELLNYEPLGNRGALVVRQTGVPKLRDVNVDEQEKRGTSVRSLRRRLSSRFWGVLNGALSSAGDESGVLVHVCSHGLFQQLPLGMRGSQDCPRVRFSHWPGLPYLRMAAETASSVTEPGVGSWLIGHDGDRDGRIAFLPMTVVEASLLEQLVKDRERAVQRISSARQIHRQGAALVLCCHGDTAKDSRLDRTLVFGEQALSVREIVDQAIGPPFALLPVCHGGDTDEDSAGNALGIAAAFLLAGSRVVVASSKAVPDALMPWLSTLIVWHVLRGLRTHEAAHLGIQQFAACQFPEEYRTWLKSALPEALGNIQPGGAEYEQVGERGRATIMQLARDWPWDADTADTAGMFDGDVVRREQCTREVAERVLIPNVRCAQRLRAIMRELAAFVFVYGTHPGDITRECGSPQGE